MKPIFSGGHAAYQKHLISQIRKHYPNSILDFDSNTWGIIDKTQAPLRYVALLPALHEVQGHFPDLMG